MSILAHVRDKKCKTDFFSDLRSGPMTMFVGLPVDIACYYCIPSAEM